jgi:hypothetical protein
MDRHYAFDEFFYIELSKAIEYRTKRFKNEEDPLRFSAPKEEGLYLIGNTVFNPFTMEEFYFIKVGASTNIYKRMNTYRSTNPSIFHIDYYLRSEWKRGMNEQGCHFVCREIGMAVVERTSEWFRVDRQTYLEICSKGFVYFEEKIHSFLTTGKMI